MSLPKVHEDQAAIVLLGKFNPAIFQPAWLAAKGLIRESEAEAANIEVIHPEITQYWVDWFHLVVQRDRFTATTTDPGRRVSLRDLVIGIFGLLEQTPTTKLGLNRSLHVDLKDVSTFHALGDLLAPKAPWDGVLHKAGLRVLMHESSRFDSFPGKMHFKVEPSQKYPHSAFFDVNSEYHTPINGEDATAYFVTRIAEDWDQAIVDAGKGVEKLVDQVMGRE
jgi:hypothetical protein